MDFNNLQSVWDDDQNNQVKIPAQLDKLKSANMPIENIRKNIKRESVIQVVCILILGLVPFFIKLSPIFQLAYYLLFILSLIISIYFFIKLYFFYKRMNNTSAATKDNLYETYFDIKLNIELYKSFTYLIMPFGLFYAVLLPMGSKYDKVVKLLQRINNTELLVVAAVIFIALFMALIWAMTEAHTKMFYGKYASEIKKVIDELKEV
jgi:heme/copper-type cytochrome/quinol oxidase subunit 4